MSGYSEEYPSFEGTLLVVYNNRGSPSSVILEMRSDLFEQYECSPVQRTVSLLVVVALVAALGGSAAMGAASGDVGFSADAFEQMDVDPDDVLIQVTVDANGDAAWEVQYRIRLATSDEEQAFEEMREDIDADPDAYTDQFRERMVATADAAETATGREMEVTETTVTAERRELPQSYGVVTYQFRWSGFAAVDDDNLVIGDAIDGLFLDEASSLIISWPDGYGLVDASPSPTETRDGAVVWAGPIDFTNGEPRVTVEPDGYAVSPLLLLLVGLVILGGGAAAYRWRRGDSAVAVGDTDSDAASEEGVSDATGRSDVTEATEATDSTEVSDQTTEKTEPHGTEEVGETTSESADVSGSSPDEALLSNEEQVLRLIESNGGRMKQKRVAEELDWTAAKTSQVVTGLRDDDAIDGFRLGRENVLSLPSYDVQTSGDRGSDDEETGDREA